MAQTATLKNKLTFRKAFSSFSSNDIEKAKKFYGDIMGLKIIEEKEGIGLEFEGGHQVFIYPKDDHQPATFTVLNFNVNDITAAVHKLSGLGVNFESYSGELMTDENGIFWGKKHGSGPNIAWFKDPAGNFLSVIETA